MGKAGRWFRSFLPGKKDREREKDRAESLSLPLPSAEQASALPTPGAKEKRRWSFRRPAGETGKGVGLSGHGQLASVSAHGFLASRMDPDPHAVAMAVATAAAAEAAAAAKHAAAAVIRLTASAPVSKRTVIGIEDAAAIKIQSVFRSYLARKALCALRGLVKLQALVRGHLVRRQASNTLRCMQALVAAQLRARAARLRLLEDEKPTRTPRQPPSRRSPQHPRSRHHLEMEENVKIVEVDTGVGGELQGTPRTSRRGSCYSTPLSRTPSKLELYQKLSPTPSALTDASARTYSSRYEEFSFATARRSPCHYSPEVAKQSNTGKACHDDHPLFFPNYMANTESSRAKARSQSAPKQRPVADAPLEMSRQPSGRRRASLEGPVQTAARTLLSRGPMRVQWCPSQAASPWAVRLDMSSVSLHDSDCGSTSTVMTTATAAHCRSMTSDNAGMT